MNTKSISYYDSLINTRVNNFVILGYYFRENVNKKTLKSRNIPILQCLCDCGKKFDKHHYNWRNNAFACPSCTEREKQAVRFKELREEREKLVNTWVHDLFIKDVVVEKNKKNQYTQFVICKCRCGKEPIILSAHSLCRGESKRCKKCQSISKRKGVGHTALKKLKNATIRNNKVVNLEVNEEDLLKRFEKQNGKCGYSGVSLTLSELSGNKRTNASVDRIDSEGHYSVDNIHWVHKKINIMKMNLPEKEFLEWCRLISNHSVYNLYLDDNFKDHNPS